LKLIGCGDATSLTDKNHTGADEDAGKNQLHIEENDFVFRKKNCSSHYSSHVKVDAFTKETNIKLANFKKSTAQSHGDRYFSLGFEIRFHNHGINLRRYCTGYMSY